MSWWGKIIGGTFGFMLGGPLGALLGGALGHQFDKGLRGMREAGGPGFRPGDQERIQTAFFTATFSVMGHLAKVDGRVSKQEIELASTVMSQMSLNAEQRKLAIRLFNQGKAPDFPLDDVLQQFRQECHRRWTLLQMFLEIQIHAAYADGVMHATERDLLLHICERLGFSKMQFERLDAMVRAQRFFHEQAAGEGARPAPRRDVLREAYDLLGISKDATDAEVKKAYRRLMNQHHPDKLTARGMPEEMIKLATEKTQEIKAAYDAVKDARGMR